MWTHSKLLYVSTISYPLWRTCQSYHKQTCFVSTSSSQVFRATSGGSHWSWAVWWVDIPRAAWPAAHRPQSCHPWGAPPPGRSRWSCRTWHHQRQCCPWKHGKMMGTCGKLWQTTPKIYFSIKLRYMFWKKTTKTSNERGPGKKWTDWIREMIRVLNPGYDEDHCHKPPLGLGGLGYTSDASDTINLGKLESQLLSMDGMHGLHGS